MIRRLASAITRPSISILTILTGITGAVVAVSINLGVGLLSAVVLGMLSVAMTSEP